MHLPPVVSFLHNLYQGQTEGYLTLTAIHPARQLPTPSRHIPLGHPAALQVALRDLARANALGWGAYFSVAVRRHALGRWQRGGKADLLNLPALFADLDGDLSTSLDRLQHLGRHGLPPPSGMVGSGRGLHLYWSLSPPTTEFALAEVTLRGLAEALGGDKLTVANALRLPASHNTKPTVDRPCQLLWWAAHRRYTLADFRAYQPPPRTTSPLLKHSPLRAPPTLNPTLIHAVVETLVRGYGGFWQRNGWLASCCPAGHTRDHPGRHFAFQPHLGIGHCFGVHARLYLTDLCQLLQLNPADYGGVYHSST